ncbi:dGTP triphosphohydrolase [Mycobacteroides abscessus]|uniref:DNTP triphosphohydrolase n=1 Tax=Mycobacteroides abscessus TaxID=36809 RepID=A0ABD7HHZ1_9MYCO|nr:dNTP triphosphohydrolase [Mycobacteroides abscessus]PVB15919.1 dNTP triphosphohydrolase [Mycobacteroides abscessus]RIR40389.1 dNTP triphosphohydrolase [Mycobacteroides abscessus]RIS62004.1 dNTP triphosphohydrolase [Mycobacteroides abscessus]RIT29267.1 dNTP triphosphohydrolase [Mycobacteroides abscessus]
MWNTVETQDFLIDSAGNIVNPSMDAARSDRISGTPKRKRDGDFRSATQVDKDRVLYSSYLKRLAGVSQVVSPTLKGGPHSRLMHSFKVSNVAREIGADLCTLASRSAAEGNSHLARLIAFFGGLDITACEVAGLAHDFGHPPFGHPAERVMDQWIRDLDPNSDGFEGNAQTVRIVTQLDRRNPRYSIHALDLTAVSMRALLKYPWLRDYEDTKKAIKFCVYQRDEDVLESTNIAIPEFVADEELMSAEACVMEIADDLTYAMHDLQDFYELGLIDFTRVERELLAAYSSLSSDFLINTAAVGNAFVAQALRLELGNQFDHRFYRSALVAIQTWIHDNPILFESFDNSPQKSATMRRIVSEKIKEILSGLRISRSLEDAQRYQLIHLEPDEWHQLQVLRTIAVQSVLSTPVLAIHERAQVTALTHVLNGLEEICHSRSTAAIPHPLQDFISSLDGGANSAIEVRCAIADYVCGLTDQNCIDLARFFCGIEVPEVGRYKI